MKRIILFSLIALSVMVSSCTADAIPQGAAHTKSAPDIGGQTGQPPVPPPGP